MTGFSAKSSNRSSSEKESNESEESLINDNKDLSTELSKLNELLKSGVLTQEEFEKAKKKILDN